MPKQKDSKFKRVVTVLLNSLPKIGRIKHYEFVTSLGAGIVFDDAGYWQQTDSQCFQLTLIPNQLWSAIGLREAAEEFKTMADYLDKLSN